MTTTEWRYKLQPYKGPGSRYDCPGCGKKRKFSRYIDTETGEDLAEYVGRCDRESNCGYHFTPKQFFSANIQERQAPIMAKQFEPTSIDCLPFDLFERSVVNHEKCNLYPFLYALFGEKADRLCEDYFIGTNKHGDTVFWQADIDGKIRQAKVMRYDSMTGRRDKVTGARFIGKLIKPDGNFKQCFFGEYLLSYPEDQDKPVCLVESEKTCVIASIYYPQYLWLATGGIYGASWTEERVCRVLKGRQIILFPDVGAFDKWKTKGSLLAAVTGSRVVISDHLEKTASESDRIEGVDVADYIIKSRQVDSGQNRSVLTRHIGQSTPLYI